MTTTYLVTGASRGIGAEFVQQLRARGDAVYAAVRDPEAAVEAARAGATVMRLDVDQPQTFDAFARGIDGPIDVLVNNAGIAAGDDSIRSVDSAVMDRVLRTNVAGPALLTRAVLPILERGRRKTIVNVSSSLGSLATTTGGFSYAYCASKAALNMLTVLMARELEGDGFTVVSLDPGWNRTDMGGMAAPLDPRDTVRGMIEVIGKLGPDDSGSFVGWDGAARPW